MPRSKEQHCAEEKARYWSNRAEMRKRRNAARELQKERRRTQARTWYREHREQVLSAKKPLTDTQKERARVLKRAGRLLRLYGITVLEFDARLVAQDNRCAICRNEIAEPKIAVDHDHVTGEVRGLLCLSCNMALGLFKDDIGALYNAVAYLLGPDPIAVNF